MVLTPPRGVELDLDEDDDDIVGDARLGYEDLFNRYWYYISVCLALDVYCQSNLVF